MIRSRPVLSALAAVCLAAGCATGSPPMVLHTLVPPAPETAVARDAPSNRQPFGVTVALAVVPEEVDRSQLVMRAADGSIAMLDNERWAEPLKAALPRAIALSMGRRMPAALVAGYPATGLSKPAWRVSLEVQRFELRRSPAPRATLRVVWSIRPGDGDAAAISRLTDISVAGDAGTPATTEAVAAMTRAVDQLAGDIAAAICERERC